MDVERLRHRLRRRHHHRRRARRPARTAEGLHHRSRPVQCRLCRLRPGAERVRVDRRPGGSRARRRDRPAAQPDHPDDRFPGSAARDDHRDLRRARRSRSRDGTDRRRRRHARHRLALDLLDQRPDRRHRRAARRSAATRELRRTRATRPDGSRPGHRRRRLPGLGAEPRCQCWLVKCRGRRHAGRGGGAACRLRPVGELGLRADAAPAPVFGPRVRDRQPDDVPHVRRNLRRRAVGHGGVPARAPLLAGWRRGASASVLRDADVRLTHCRLSLRSDRPPADHGRRAEHAGSRVRLGRLARLPGHELDRARDRAPDRRRGDLDGPPDSANRSVERGRAARDGQGLRDQLHGAALRRGLRDRGR